ncbi:MAG: hypothetical protein ACKPGH_02290, partial [Dolichospermum sp.]
LLFSKILSFLAGLTQNISQTLFSSFSSFLRGSLFRDLCVSPIYLLTAIWCFQTLPNFSLTLE